jgi:transketolase
MLRFEASEQGMAACLTGMAAHGGLLPCGIAPLRSADQMRPALHLAGAAARRVVFCFEQDSCGADFGRLASLRALPNTFVFRPADGLEAAECWEIALKRGGGPSVMVLEVQTSPCLRSRTGENFCARGGYVLAEAEGPRQATLAASGPEAASALAAREALAAEGIAAAVVSLPCWELFAAQDPGYRAAVLGGAPRVGIEWDSAFGWEQWLGPDGTFIGMSGSLASPDRPPAPDVIVSAVKKRLQS